MFYPDLSPYNQGSKEFECLNTIAIGWLDSKFPFPKESPSEIFLKHLLIHCKLPFLQTRGYHYCELNDHKLREPVTVGTDGDTTRLGSAEIRVIGDRKVYAAPDLIYHYVKDHLYRPPDEFIYSVVNGIQPGEKRYQSLVEMYENLVFTKFF